MSQWYYAQHDEQFGPISSAELKEMAQCGELERDDLLWREGMQRWAPARKVKGLFPESELSADGDDGNASDHTDDFSGGSDMDQLPLDGPLDATAIDDLPLGGPEESKLHVPTLTIPAQSPPVGESDDPVQFEPTAPPRQAVLATTEGRSPTAARKPPGRRTRIDDAEQPNSKTTVNIGLFAQTFVWVSCLMAVLTGGLIFLMAIVTAPDATARMSASAIYVAVVLAVYILARTTERLARVVSQWRSNTTQANIKRVRKERNWKRFQ